MVMMVVGTDSTSFSRKLNADEEEVGEAARSCGGLSSFMMGRCFVKNYLKQNFYFSSQHFLKMSKSANAATQNYDSYYPARLASRDL